MDKYFAYEAVVAAKNDAVLRYPEESCGAIIGGVYYPMTNIAAPAEQHVADNPSCGCKLCSFKFDTNELLSKAAGRDVEAIIHSHPNGPLYPSQADMECQINTNVPWGIIATNGERASDIVAWGDGLPIEPLIGRRFMHGVHDCYALIRDAFRLGREELAKQDIIWPFDPIELPNVPRDDSWWDNGQDLYVDYLERAGFRRISMNEARPGDGMLMIIESNDDSKPKHGRMNHAGVLLEHGLFMHHLPGEHRVSRREPVGGWGRMAELFVRYEPKSAEVGS